MHTNNFKKTNMKTNNEFFEMFQKFRSYADDLRKNLNDLNNSSKEASEALRIKLDRIFHEDPLNFDKMSAPIFQAHLKDMNEIYNIYSFIHQVATLSMNQLDRHVSSIREIEDTEHEIVSQG